jgi:hypothetical protein
MYAVIPNSTPIQTPLVGVCGLTSIDWVNRRAEFSLYIDPDRQKDGLGKAALQTLLHHGFMTLGLNCIWGETFDLNPAAKLFEGLGFIKEGSRRDFYYRDGRFIDAHLYSLLRRHWDNRVLDGDKVGQAQGPQRPSSDGHFSAPFRASTTEWHDSVAQKASKPPKAPRPR